MNNSEKERWKEQNWGKGNQSFAFPSIFSLSLDQIKEFFLFILSVMIVFCFTMLVNKTEYPYDSSHYFALSKTLFFNGRFSIGNFPITIRGIIFPLILYPFNRLANFILGSDLLGWRLLISLLSGFFSLAFRYIFRRIGKTHFIPLPLFLLLIMFYGLFSVPLSDLVAVYFLVFSLSILIKAYARINEKSFGFFELFLFTFSGLLYYAAYNTRTIYLFVLPFIILIILINRNIGKLRSIVIFFAIFIGVVLLGSIQVISNKKLYDKFSFAVPTSDYGGSGLFLHHLFLGMRADLYETYMGGGRELAGYVYTDTAGLGLQRTEAANAALGYTGYLRILCKYPIEMLGIYARHFFALMNPINGGGYVYSHKNSFFRTLLNYTLLFGFIKFVKRKKRIYLNGENKKITLKTIKKQISFLTLEQKTIFLVLLALLVPFACIIAGQPEERFALPLWLIIFGFYSYVINPKEEFFYYRKKPFFHLVSWFIGFVIFITILTAIYGNNPEGTFLPILKTF